MFRVFPLAIVVAAIIQVPLSAGSISTVYRVDGNACMVSPSTAAEYGYAPGGVEGLRLFDPVAHWGWVNCPIPTHANNTASYDKVSVRLKFGGAYTDGERAVSCLLAHDYYGEGISTWDECECETFTQDDNPDYGNSMLHFDGVGTCDDADADGPVPNNWALVVDIYNPRHDLANQTLSIMMLTAYVD